MAIRTGLFVEHEEAGCTILHVGHFKDLRLLPLYMFCTFDAG